MIKKGSRTLFSNVNILQRHQTALRFLPRPIVSSRLMLYKLHFIQYSFVSNNTLHILRMALQLAACLYRIIHCLLVFPRAGSIMIFFTKIFKEIWHIKKKLFGISDSADVFVGKLYGVTGL